MTPPRSLGRYAPGVRLRLALRTFSQWSGGDNEARKKSRAKAAGNPFFHRLRPPARVHINRRFFGASVGAVRLNHESNSTGETRQDLKIPTVSGRSLPLALSCSDPAVYRIPVPPLSLAGSVALSHSSHAGISARCRSFAPSWAVSKNSPFSPTAAPYPVTVHLSPTRKSTQKTPLAAATGNRRFAGTDERKSNFSLEEASL